MQRATLAFLLCLASAAFAQQPSQSQQRPGQGQGPREQGGGGPPPEALDACKGKKEGDNVQMKTPRGDSMSATCRLVAVPVRPADDGKGPPRRQ